MKVTLLMAITLDGKIGKDSNHFPDWTGKEDKKLFVEMTKKTGVLIMGSKTFDTIGRPLPKRKNIIMTRDKTRISEWENLVFTQDSPKEILKKLEKEGFEEVILAGGRQINTIFAKEKLINEIVVTVSPFIFGKGLGLFTDEIFLNLSLLDMKQISEDVICLNYRVLV